MAGNSTERFRASLREAGFPEVLCPRSVADVRLDGATGRFELHLEGPMLVPIGATSITFDAQLTGYLHPLRIWGLAGVYRLDRGDRTAITEVRVDERSTMLTFHVAGQPMTIPFEAFV